MRTLNCFVIMPSGMHPPMRLAMHREDEKESLCLVPSSCTPPEEKVTTVNFQDVYKYIVCAAIDRVNDTCKGQGLEIKCTRGEIIEQSGEIVWQVLDRICRADITITDVTGHNPNVLFEYGIRLSVRDSLNILLRHKGVALPFNIFLQRAIDYTTAMAGVQDAVERIVRTIEEAMPELLGQAPQKGLNQYRLTIETATGRDFERRLTQVLDPAPALMAELANELRRLGRAEPKLRDRCWGFLETLAKTLTPQPLGRERAIEIYRLLTTLDGFHDKRRDAFYELHKICVVDPTREAEAQAYLEQAKALET